MVVVELVLWLEPVVVPGVEVVPAPAAGVVPAPAAGVVVPPVAGVVVAAGVVVPAAVVEPLVAAAVVEAQVVEPADWTVKVAEERECKCQFGFETAGIGKGWCRGDRQIARGTQKEERGHT